MSTSPDNLEAVLQGLLLFIVADATGAFTVGACFTLGIVCLALLSSQAAGPRKQRRLLQLYIVLLLTAVVGLFISAFFAFNSLVIFNPTQLKSGEVAAKVVTSAGIFTGVSICMTDGLLVWRCYMVHKALMGHSSSLWSKIFCAIPAVLWIVTFITGIMVSMPSQQFSSLTVFLVSNALTNLCGTAFIATRLLQHRQMTRDFFKDKAPTARHGNIVGILLESAAINVPVAICEAVGNMIMSTSSSKTTYGVWFIIYSIGIPSQVRQPWLLTTSWADHVLSGTCDYHGHPPGCPRQGDWPSQSGRGSASDDKEVRGIHTA
ncbi:hypothetical protein P691DRAFT_401390 [Macrolepiota fuliginosa MF-IS2]|uniref:Uncharacterized protein n=1 Tax=Macrolepiota fuliginosa MF-IS2 TaxID=1400762 RepID=A0A9P5X3B5_9AGAR|nr:hypothetical protein P691DRAFT_401390 [Macrolepiota fuliginosa MF-IS2]